jgi:hypothetical protein
MLAAADRIPAVRRQLDAIPPYALVVNQRRRDLLLAELEVLTRAARINTHQGDDHGRP